MNDDKLIQLVNEERKLHNLSPLKEVDELQKSSMFRAEEICETSNWSHDGWINVVASYYSYKNAGENLAKNYDSEAETVKAWMDSPTHAKNILGDYSETGMSTFECSNGNTYTVQHFGTPYVQTYHASGVNIDLLGGIAVGFLLTVILLSILSIFQHKKGKTHSKHS